MPGFVTAAPPRREGEVSHNFRTPGVFYLSLDLLV